MALDLAGKVIAFDGPDGVGKSTQLMLLADYLRAKGLNVHTTRSSGGTPIGEELRKASLSDHPRHAETDMFISLATGTELGFDIQERRPHKEVILIDRSPLAMLAYQVYGSQLPHAEEGYAATLRLFKHWQLDAVLIFNAEQKILNERMKKRYAEDSGNSHNYFEKRGPAYFERVRQGYQAAPAFMAEHPELNVKVITIDASPSIEDIQAEVRRVLSVS